VKSKKNEQPNWRPNFRIQETLPDIKVIRTDFLVNGVAAVILLAAIAYAGMVFMKYMNKGAEIAELNKSIQEKSSQNSTLLGLSRQFVKEKAQADELQKFYGVPVGATDFIFLLAELKPEDIRIESVNFRTESVSQGGRGRKPPKHQRTINIEGFARNLEIIKVYRDALEYDELFKDHLESILDLPGEQNAQTGEYSFTIRIETTPV